MEAALAVDMRARRHHRFLAQAEADWTEELVGHGGILFEDRGGREPHFRSSLLQIFLDFSSKVDREPQS